IYYVATHRPQAARPVSLLVSALVPALVGLLMVSVLEPRHNRRRPVPPRLAQQWQVPRPVAPQLSEPYVPAPMPVPVNVLTEADAVQTVSFPVFQLQNTSPEAAAESALLKQPGYVAGSFRL